jgi:hypothetical protein
LVVGAALSILGSSAARAHDRTISYSGWVIEGRRAEVAVRLTQLDVSRFPWAASAGDALDDTLGRYLTAQLQLLAGEQVCDVIGGPQSLAAAAGRLAFEWRVACPADGPLRIRSQVFLDVVPSALHFARVARDRHAPLERVLSEAEPTWPLDNPPTATASQAEGTTLFGYLALGVEHILTGYDHLAFLAALLLIGGSLRSGAAVVTGFTVAHSITLALTVLGIVRPATVSIESLIGLSIALVAAENLWLSGPRSVAVPAAITGGLALLAVAAARGYGEVSAVTLAGMALFSGCYLGLLRRVTQPSSLRWGIAFLFGLVHGFGFASVLIEAGLPARRLMSALFGFNAGVEIGQLAMVALLWPALQWISRGSTRRRLAVLQYGSAVVLALGVFWFVERAYG